MAVSLTTRKLVLFCSAHAPIWSDPHRCLTEQCVKEIGLGADDSLSGTHICQILGIADGSPYNWRKGRGVSQKSLDKIKKNIEKNWIKGADGYFYASRNGKKCNIITTVNMIPFEDINVEKFSEYLGFSTEEKSKILDCTFFHDSPMLMSMYYNGGDCEREIVTDLRFLKGSYEASMNRLINYELYSTIKARIDVPYAVEVIENRRSLIRVKAWIRGYNEDTPSFNQVMTYDGWVRILKTSQNTRHAVWILQRRSEDIKDFVFIISDLPVNGNMGGKYTTIDQLGLPMVGEIRFKGRSEDLSDLPFAD